MTNLDIVTTVLSETTGHSRAHWDHVVRSAIAAAGMSLEDDTKFLEVLPNDEAQATLATLRREKSGILNWLVIGRQQAIAQGKTNRRFQMYLNHQQN